MKRKIILTGIVLFSMLLFAACGEEKPLADRVIENLEDCMGAREVTEEEYEEIKRKTLIDPVYYFHSLRTENAYLICKESDLTKVNISLSFDTDEDLETEYALLYKYENEVDNRNSYIKVSLYEFVNDEQAEKYMEYLECVCGKYYTSVKEDDTSQKLFPDDRKLGKVEGEDYIYVVIDYKEDETYVEAIYAFLDGNQVIEINYFGHEDNEIYPKYQKFLKKMKFEGLNDIELEYAEPQS